MRNGYSGFSHVLEIKILNPRFKGLLEDVKAEDKNKICVQVRVLFVLGNRHIGARTLSKEGN
ncbi:MAG: hypothetical protein HBSAPP01_14980 [Candidatus Brocadia sapporoensis]|nr:MAG: hypothetical protein HBSAPP01_14980 [Candidatus Brocadia sapporoensis]